MSTLPPSPYVFSRGSLKMTYELCRKTNPRLGLNLLNIMGGEPLPKDPEASDNKHSDHFTVTLDSFGVRAVVEILAQHNQQGGESNNAGMVSMTNALLDDWLALAHQMITELPVEQRPK